jgi:hypothetical protein
MFFDDVAEKSNSFLDVGVVEFFQLLDEDVEHGDSDLGLLGVVGVDVLGGFFGLFFFGVVV